MTPRRLFTRAGLAAFAASALITLSPKASHAEQFTLFDVTFNFTWEDAINASPSKSHYYVKSDKLNPMRPTNWIAPIDYRTGKVHIYLEVLEKPEGGQKQGWALCYVGGGSYGCPYTKYYTEKGIYESDVDMTSFYNNATIDWTKGITEVDLVYTINDSGSGHVHFFPELKDKTTPTKVRIAMVQVSKGATYDPSKLPGGMGAGGTGAGGGSGMGGSGGAGGMTAGGSGGTSAGAGGVASGGSAGTDSSTGGVMLTAGAGGTGVVPAGGMANPGTAGAQAGGSGTTGPDGGNSDDSAGCAVGPAPVGSNTAWFTVFALAGLGRVLRRRQMRLVAQNIN